MTAHKVADTVRSNVTAQGMRRGERFEIVAVVPGRSCVVTYRLHAEDGRELEVGNGYLLLDRIANVR